MKIRPPTLASAAVLVGALVFVAIVGVAIVRLVVPRPPPAEARVPPPMGPALTGHLALIIVDGLRVDVANDPERMPEMARRMAEHTSGEIWSGPVSMTSSAILTYATGQRGDIDQIVNNESGSPTPYNDLVRNARAAGLVTACTGDRAWFKFFPGAWTLAHPDPAGVAIDFDYNAEIFEAAHQFVAARPGFTVMHFVTPDHQAHAYGVLSERYRAHIRAFDRTLTELLDAIPKDTTVFITSDHGATDTGTHGSDTPIQRRSPIVAYGPGIVAHRQEGRPLDQVDIPSTFAALLGISAPAHGRGHILVDWLDLPDVERARLACADLARLARYAASVLDPADPLLRQAEGACAASAPRDRIDAAMRSARALDEAVGRDGGKASALGWLVPATALLLALLLAIVALGRRLRERAGTAAVTTAIVLVSLGVSVLLTHSLELLPGRWPNPVRAILYVAANAVLLAAVLRPRAALAWVDRRVALGLALVPGLLVVTPTKTTQPEAFALAAVIAAVALTIGIPPPPPAGRWQTGRARLALVAVLVLALVPLSFQESNFVPKAIASSPIALRATAWLAIALLAAATARRGTASGFEAGAGAFAAALSLELRGVAPAQVCIAAWLGLPFAAIAAARAGRRGLAELLALASYAWVAREAEIPILIATYVVAAEVGAAFARSARPPRPSVVVGIVTFLFGWTYVQRIGVQTGIDFASFDWGAGAFRQAGVSIVRIGAALTYKHCFARAALIYAVLAPLRQDLRSWVARGLLVAELVRVAALTAMLYVCRDSFWTSLRVIGDVPHALAAVVVAAAACVLVDGEEAATELAPAVAPHEERG